MGFLNLLPFLTLSSVSHILAEEAAHEANLLRRKKQSVYVLGVRTFFLQFTFFVSDTYGTTRRSFFLSAETEKPPKRKLLVSAKTS